MNKVKKLFVVLLICFMTIVIVQEPVSAKENNGIKVKLINKNMNTYTSEAIVEIKNKTKNSISVSRISIQKKDEKQVEMKKGEEHWVEVKRKTKKYKLKADNTKYIDLNIKGISVGEYRMIFDIKKGKKKIQKNVYFTVEEEIQDPVSSEKVTETESSPSGSTEEETTLSDNGEYETPADKPTIGFNPSKPAPYHPAGTVPKSCVKKKVYRAKQILLNGDFRIDKTGRSTAVIFSETGYKTTYKTKIDLKIQRKTKKGFKNYKRYKQIKKSNLAYMNKKLKIKKKGYYRMYVTITSYKRDGKKSVRNYKSKTVKY